MFSPLRPALGGPAAGTVCHWPLAPGVALAALPCASEMLREGADIIDIGAESTWPGAAPVPPAEQCRRVVDLIHVVRDLIVRSADTGCRRRAVISIDTISDEFVRTALDSGADWVNDTSAGRDAPGLLALAGCALNRI